MTVLHQFGAVLREFLLQIPLPVVRVLFVALPVALLVWVLFLPREDTTPGGRPSRAGENLKLWAALALLVQIMIYSIL
jgi:hypothetical protein